MEPIFTVISLIGQKFLEETSSKTIGTGIDLILTKSGLTYNVEDDIDKLKAIISRQSAMLSAIQTSISAIGLMSTVGCALSAINVYQLVKVRRSLDRIDKKIEDGFLDLKIFFEEKLKNLLEEQQKQRLSQAYSYYTKGLNQLHISLAIKDVNIRNDSLGRCISIFTNSLSIYDDKREYQSINLPAKLRRLECCWALESSIAETYFLLNEYKASLKSYEELYGRIVNELNKLIYDIDEDNYKFILSELDWIFKNDLKIIEAKIQLLKDVLSSKTFEPVKIQLTQKGGDEELFKDISISSAKLYLECLLFPENIKNIREYILNKEHLLPDIKYKFIDFNKLPLVHLCNLYVWLIM